MKLPFIVRGLGKPVARWCAVRAYVFAFFLMAGTAYLISDVVETRQGASSPPRMEKREHNKEAEQLRKQTIHVRNCYAPKSIPLLLPDAPMAP